MSEPVSVESALCAREAILARIRAAYGLNEAEALDFLEMFPETDPEPAP